MRPHGSNVIYVYRMSASRIASPAIPIPSIQYQHRQKWCNNVSIKHPSKILCNFYIKLILYSYLTHLHIFKIRGVYVNKFGNISLMCFSECRHKHSSSEIRLEHTRSVFSYQPKIKMSGGFLILVDAFTPSTPHLPQKKTLNKPQYNVKHL